MKATIESTTKIVTLIVNGHDVPARVWTGRTENGVEFHCFITRVAVANSMGVENHKEFERDLEEHSAPTPEIQAIPLRMIL